MVLFIILFKVVLAIKSVALFNTLYMQAGSIF